MEQLLEKPFRLPRAAQTVGVCDETMRRWVARKLVHSVHIGRRIYIPAEEVRRLLGERTRDWKTQACGPDGD